MIKKTAASLLYIFPSSFSAESMIKQGNTVCLKKQEKGKARERHTLILFKNGRNPVSSCRVRMQIVNNVRNNRKKCVKTIHDNQKS